MLTWSKLVLALMLTSLTLALSGCLLTIPPFAVCIPATPATPPGGIVGAC
ncbi:hypothetical protein BN000_04587 [Mycobacterium europaeum]|uniref:Lipoprotein n=1 Tax=Mycobacterium europaeum TaxID=761804 RepID=A0A0U1DR56_9MYCO|nr:hypothetical protein [Mycobacterium europaeum]CQD19601.1 hypothetical protein BN000_04587 [Mycobacterium europaeum]